MTTFEKLKALSVEDDSGVLIQGRISHRDFANLRLACAVLRLSAETLAKAAELASHGFAIGMREPKLNTDHKGVFMIVEHLEEWDGVPTANGANGPWCIVGDDLEALITEAHAFGAGMVFDSYFPEAAPC